MKRFVAIFFAIASALPLAAQPNWAATQYRLAKLEQLKGNQNRIAVLTDKIYVTIKGVTTTHVITNSHVTKKEIIYLFDGGFLHLILYAKHAAYFYIRAGKVYDLFTEEDWNKYLKEVENGERGARSL